MKRILATILSVMLVATLAISGTVAYLTDYESAVNVMTVGKVDIALHEEQRTLDGERHAIPGSALVDFIDNKNLVPVVGSVQGAENKDKWGMPTAENYVDKIVRVENVGETDAYVRVFIGVPAALENTDASKNVLHWNWGNRFDAEGEGKYNTSDAEAPFHKEFENAMGQAPICQEYITTEKGDTILYNIYCFTRKGALEDGAMSAATLVGFYLDEDVDYNDRDGYYYVGDKSKVENRITVDGVGIDGAAAYNFDNDIYIPVFAQAVQKDGFADADIAFDAAFDTDYETANPGKVYNPWADGKMEEDIVLPDYKADRTAEGQKLIDEAVVGDTVTLPAGIYKSLIVKNADGSAKDSITIKGSKGATVGFINLNGSDNCTIEDITFEAPMAKQLTTYNGGSGHYTHIVGNDGASKKDFADTTVIKNCSFNGTFSKNSGYYAPISFNENKRNSGGQGASCNLTVEGCTFNCDNAAYFVYTNYMAVGDVVIKDNTFNKASITNGTNLYINRLKGGELTVTGNKFLGDTVDKVYIRKDENDNGLTVTITDNTFHSTNDGSVVAISKTQWNANCAYTIAGNSYTGGLTCTDSTDPLV